MARNLHDESSGGNGSSMVAPLLEEDGYPGRVVGVIFLGKQPQTFNNQPQKPHQEVKYLYELSDEFMEDLDGNPLKDKPRWMWPFPMKVYSPKAEKATMTRVNAAIDPGLKITGGDAKKLIGLPVTVLVNQYTQKKGENKGELANGCGGVSRITRGVKPAPLVNEPIYFDPYDPDECSVERFRALPELTQKTILEAVDFEEMVLCRMLDEAGEKREPEKRNQDDGDTKPESDQPPAAGPDVGDDPYA